ncbi:hypothetical protein EDB89DRAFT_2018655, partial [Lactarius sanguifluus]
VTFLAVALVLRGPTVFCPIAPTVRTISTTTGPSSVYLEALSSSSSSLSAGSTGGGGGGLGRTPPALDVARGCQGGAPM